MAAEIRRRRIVEASLLKSEEALKGANKELEAFSYSVSHDLRAPLRHVSGFVQLLQANAKGKLDETGMRYLDVISGAAKRMGNLIDDLLSFSRTGRAQINVEPIPLSAMVDECKKELELEMKGRAIEWTIGELPEVHADRPLLRQVMANLLGNAVKYSGKREVAKIEISAWTEGEEQVVCVRDNGAGFDMKYANKLFGVFSRLHGDSEFEGTGIGLANVRRIVLRHGGRTWAEGEVDKGAAFFFTLPLNPQPPQPENAP
jgi:light-regulated signal transduction histidine kinase (bacteriophytochrome)